MLRRLALAFVLLLASGCQVGSGSGAEGSATTAAPPPHRVGSDGVTVRLPAGWHETFTEPGSGTDPVVRLAVSSGPIQPGDAPCQVSAYDFPDDAVAIVVVEWRSRELLAVHGPGALRPERFTVASLPIQEPPAIECFEGPGGSAHFFEAGRSFGAYVLLGPRAPAQLASTARAVLDTLEVEMQLPRPVELVALADELVAECRRSALIRPTCPTLVPRVGEAYVSNLDPDVLGPTGVLDVFDLEQPSLDWSGLSEDRPPTFAHIGLLAGETERISRRWAEPWSERARALRDGLFQRERKEPISLGLATWGDLRGLLFLAPSYPTGGYLGDHLVFVRKAGATRWAVTLHAWEPLSEAVATLRALTLSAADPARAPTLAAMSDADGVLYVDGSGWACGERVLVDLPEPWASTNAEVTRGELHLVYPRPAVAPYRGTVTARQRCGDATILAEKAPIAVGDERAG